MSSIDIELKELQEEYLLDLPDKLDEIEASILELENGVIDANVLKRLRGNAHNIKGSAGSFYLNHLTTLFHKFEDFLANTLDRGTFQKNIDNFLKAVDLSRKLVVKYTNEEMINKDEFEAQLVNILSLPKSISHHSVLIVERSKIQRKIFRSILDELQVEISFADCSYAAFGRLVNEHFDSLITANRLELLDGPSLISALRAIKSPNKNIPTILTSSDCTRIEFCNFKPDFIVEKDLEMGNKIKTIYHDLLSAGKSRSYTKSITKKNNKKLETIIFVDDDNDIHNLIKIGFKNEKQLTIKFCRSGNNALGMLQKMRADLIVLDVEMPEMDGPTLLEKLRTRNCLYGASVFFLTAKSTDSDIKKLLDLGVDGILQKPFKPHEIFQTIMDLWEKRY